MTARLFVVERSTQPARRRTLTIDRYAVVATSPEEAVEIAKRRAPQDEFDGPAVEWTAEEDADGIVLMRSVIRRPK